ncbi:hypothetical protein VUR80DRAFT_9395 [Thermomyces stellatus]
MLFLNTTRPGFHSGASLYPLTRSRSLPGNRPCDIFTALVSRLYHSSSGHGTWERVHAGAFGARNTNAATKQRPIYWTPAVAIVSHGPGSLLFAVGRIVYEARPLLLGVTQVTQDSCETLLP